MPYRKYGGYGRSRRRRSYTPRLRRYRQSGSLRTAGSIVSSARYYDLYTNRAVFRRSALSSNLLTADAYTDWTVAIGPDGATLPRLTAIQKTMLPMEIGTGYGTAREQTYKLHGFHARFNFRVMPDMAPITSPQNPATTGMSGAFGCRLILYFDTSGFGTIQPNTSPADLLGNQVSTQIDPIVQPKNMFFDATRFKIVADKRFVLKPRVQPYKDPADPLVDNFMCFGDRRLIDVHWRAPRPVLVRVNDLSNSATSVGNLQLYCAVFQDEAEVPTFPDIFPVSYTSSCRIFFSNP